MPRNRSPIQQLVDTFRGGQNTEIQPEQNQSMPPQTMQGLLGSLSGTTNLTTGTALTLEDLEMEMNEVRSSTHNYIRSGIGLTTNRVSEEQTQQSLKRDKKWERLYRSKYPMEEKVSYVLADASSTMKDSVREMLSRKENNQRDARKSLREFRIKFKQLNQEILDLQEKKKELEKETAIQKKQRLQRIVQDVLALPKVEKIEVDENGRIFITTSEIEIKKDYWDKPRIAGRYQILVDFYKSNINDGVRVLNVTRRLDDQYDHPCINNTKPCWGNIQGDIQKDFDDRDLLELVVDMLLYISSPNDENGWLTYAQRSPEERRKMGWEQFLEFAEPVPKNYSFITYERHPPISQNTTNVLNPDVNVSLDASQLIVPVVREREDHQESFTITEDAGDGIQRIMHLLRLMINFEGDNPNEDIGLEEFCRVTYNQLRRDNFIFIRRIEFIYPTRLSISGFGVGGERFYRVTIPSVGMRLEVHRPILSFSDPEWFTRVVRGGYHPSLQYYASDVGQASPRTATEAQLQRDAVRFIETTRP